MLHKLPALAAMLLLISCSGGGTAPPRPSPAASPAAVPSALPLLPPSADILDGPQGGLPRTGGVDHLDLEQAAAQQENQPLALVTYRSWGWVDEATRTWAGGGGSADESLLLLTRVEGARLAFADTVRARFRSPLLCPSAVGADQCAEGAALLVARLDRYVFTLRGSGVNLEQLAALQVQRINRPAGY